MQVSGDKIGALVQARTGSSRLPNKVLADLAGAPLLLRVLERVWRARTLDLVAVVTTTEADDDAVVALCREHGVECFRGSVEDVLDRYLCAARELSLGSVVRISGDCPLIDPAVVDEIVGAYRDGGYDYVSNTLRHTYPDGVDAEAFSVEALERAWNEATLAPDREHVTPFIKRGNGFKVRNIDSPVALPERGTRWTVDEPRDLDFVRAVYHRLGPAVAEAGVEDVIALVEGDPALADINAGIVRYEGYYRSLAREPGLPAAIEVPEPPAEGAPPISRRAGSRVWDQAGNQYLDLWMDGGAALLGHESASPAPATPTAARAALARVSGVEAVQLYASHDTATEAAAHAARTITGRQVVAWVPYGDRSAAERLLAAAPAALLVEPLGWPGTPDAEFLHGLREQTADSGALLIFDERLGALRVAPGGAGEHFGIAADLSILGSAIAAGRPVAAVGGRGERVERAADPAWTAPAETLAAIVATAERAGAAIPHLWEQGRKLQDGLNVLADVFGIADRVGCAGLAPRAAVWARDPSDASRLRHECLRRGLLLVRGAHNVSAAHSDADVDLALRVYRAVFEHLAAG